MALKRQFEAAKLSKFNREGESKKNRGLGGKPWAFQTLSQGDVGEPAKAVEKEQPVK